MAQTFPLNSTDLPDAPAWAELDATLAGLPDAWTVLRERRIGGPDGPHVDFLLVHPEIGIALVAVPPEDPGPAKAALAAYLGRERFGEFYPGVLPVVAVTIGPDEIASVGNRLADAFDQVPSLDIGDPEWSEAAIELLLTPGDLAMASIAPPADAQGEAAPAEEPSFAPSGRDAAPRPAAAVAPTVPAFEAPPAPRPAWLADLDRAPPRPFADPPYLTRPPRRRWYGVAAIAGGLVIVCGIAIGAATRLLDNEPAGVAAGDEVASSSVPLPPAPGSSRSLPSTPQGAPSAAVAPAASPAPPPVPPPAPVIAAAKPLLPPPAPGPRLTRVDPLPSPPAPPAPVVAAAPPKPAVKPAIAAATPPKPPAKAEAAAPPPKPAPRVARKEPPAKPPHRQEVATARPPAKQAEPPQAAPAPRVASREPATQDMPPIDAADLPPLAPAAGNSPPGDAARHDVARAEPASTVPPPAPIGAPIQLLAPAVSAGSTTPPPAARPPAATQSVGPPVPLLPPAVSRPAAAPRESRAIPIESPESAGPPIVTARLDERECRPYTSDTSLMGQARPVRGMACREADGRWHLVSELPQR